MTPSSSSPSLPPPASTAHLAPAPVQPPSTHRRVSSPSPIHRRSPPPPSPRRDNRSRPGHQFSPPGYAHSSRARQTWSYRSSDEEDNVKSGTFSSSKSKGKRRRESEEDSDSKMRRRARKERRVEKDDKKENHDTENEKSMLQIEKEAREQNGGKEYKEKSARKVRFVPYSSSSSSDESVLRPKRN